MHLLKRVGILLCYRHKRQKYRKKKKRGSKTKDLQQVEDLLQKTVLPRRAFFKWGNFGKEGGGYHKTSKRGRKVTKGRALTSGERLSGELQRPQLRRKGESPRGVTH